MPWPRLASRLVVAVNAKGMICCVHRPAICSFFLPSERKTQLSSRSELPRLGKIVQTFKLFPQNASSAMYPIMYPPWGFRLFFGDRIKYPFWAEIPPFRRGKQHQSTRKVKYLPNKAPFSGLPFFLTKQSNRRGTLFGKGGLFFYIVKYIYLMT